MRLKIRSVSSRPIKSVNGLLLTTSALLAMAAFHAAPAQAKSFFEVVERPLLTHPELKSSEANVKAQHEVLDDISGQYFPSINLNGGIGLENSETKAIKNKSLTRSELSLGLTQLVYDGNAINSRYNQQDSIYRSSKYKLIDDQNEMMLKAINTYLDAVKTREIAMLAKANEQEHISTLDKVKQLYTGGAGRRGDISLAEGRLAQTRATLVRLDNNIKDANANFKAIIGEDLTYKVRWPQVAETYLPKSLDDAVNTAMRSNPALLLVREDAAAADYAIGANKASFLPTVNLELNAARNNNLDGTEGKNNELIMMVRGVWNLYRGGSDVAKYNQSVQRQIEATENVGRTRRVVVQQATQAWNQYQASLARLEQLRKHMVASREVLDAYEEQFKYGQRQLFNLLDQQNELFDSKVSYVNGRDEMIRRSFVLLKETGKIGSYVLEERGKEKSVEAKKREQEALQQRRQQQQQVLEQRMNRMQQEMNRSKQLQEQLESRNRVQ